MMLLRINSLVRGHSGISLAVLNQFVALLNLGIHPVVPCQGSVGASGDLCPLSHLALPLIGHGSVRYRGRTMAAAKALQMVGLAPVQLGAKEGLALNNGTASMGAMAVLALLDAECLAKTADIAAALSIEALHGVPFAFDERTHALRPHDGQGRVAGNIRRLIEEARYWKNTVRKGPGRLLPPVCPPGPRSQPGRPRLRPGSSRGGD